MTTEQLTRPSPALTAQERRLFADDGPLLELVDGKLIEKPLSALSTWLLPNISIELTLYLRAQRIGIMHQEQLFRVPRDGDPRRTRRPDLAVILRSPGEPLALNAGILEAAPDFIIEIISPSDPGEELEKKFDDYAHSNVALSWFVFPEARVVRAHRSDGTHDRFHDEPLVLDGRDVLPGLSIDLTVLLNDAPYAIMPRTDDG